MLFLLLFKKVLLEKDGSLPSFSSRLVFQKNVIYIILVTDVKFSAVNMNGWIEFIGWGSTIIR